MTTPIKHQIGGVVVYITVAIVALLAIVALVIDLSRSRIVARELQNAADAAVLSAVKQFDGTEVGWKKSKRAVLLVLKQHKIREQGEQIGNDFNFTEGADDAPIEDPLSPFRFSEGHTLGEGVEGNIRISVERGRYWAELNLEGEEDQNYKFTSLEGQAKVFNVAPYVVANAVRVSLQLTEGDTFFGGVIGIDKLGKVERSAVAVYDSKTEACALPVAVPLCDLMANTDINSGRYETNEYEAGEQCKREFVATEAHTEPAAGLIDGRIRAATYPRPWLEPMDGGANDCRIPPFLPYPSGEYPNCKASFVNGALGLPTSRVDEAVQQARSREVREVLQNRDEPNQEFGCIRARLGDRFRSLNDAVLSNGSPVDYPNGFLVDAAPNGITTYEQNLVNLINSSGVFSLPFGDVFLENGEPRPNFPGLRRSQGELVAPLDQTELLMRWPITKNPPDEATIMLRATGGIEGDGNLSWQSPACTTQGTGAKVLAAKIMVIASENDTPYCDYRNTASGNQQQSFPPTHDTNPLVVGFVDAYLIDFHVAGYRDGSPLPETDNNPLNLVSLGGSEVDRYKGEFRERTHDRRCWAGCRRCIECRQGEPPECPGGPNCEPRNCNAPRGSEPGQGCPSCDAEQCEDRRVDPFGREPPPVDVPRQLTGIWAECFNFIPPPCSPPGSLPDPDEEDPIVEAQYDEYIRCLERNLNGLGEGRPNAHCLPAKKNNCFPASDPACWELRKREPQYLCGGLRLRLDCDEDAIIPAVNSSSDVRPALVHE